MTIKKAVSVSLVLLLMLVAACSNNENTPAADNNTKAEDKEGTNDESAEVNRDPYVIKIFNWTGAAKFYSETPVGKVIKEKFNIDFELIPYPTDEQSYLNLALASGDELPEMLELHDVDTFNKYYQAGKLLPLDIEKMPNFKKMYADSIPFWKQISANAGAKAGELYLYQIYLPQDKYNYQEYNDIVIRTDLLEKAGWPKLRSADDYLEFLTQAKKDNPDSSGVVVPFANDTGLSSYSTILYEKGQGVNLSNKTNIFLAKDKKFVDMFNYPDSKETLQFFNRLYQRGLLDAESFTDKEEQVMSKMNTGKPLALWYLGWKQYEVTNALKDAGKDYGYITMPIQSNGQVARGEKRVNTLSTVNHWGTVVITKNAKHPERIQELIDFMSSEEGQLLQNSGVEGVHYTRVDGKRVATQLFNDGVAAEGGNFAYKQGMQLLYQLGLAIANSPVDGQPYNLGSIGALEEKTWLTDAHKKVIKGYSYKTFVDPWLEFSEFVPAGTEAVITIDQTTPDGMLEQKLTDFRVKNTPQLIMAKSDEEFEKLYNKILEEYNKMGSQKIIDIYNDLYQKAEQELSQFK